MVGKKKIDNNELFDVIDVMWINNKKILNSNINKSKPCHKLGYCPYGAIVELFRLRDERDSLFSCKVFGHDCPMFYNAEDVEE